MAITIIRHRQVRRADNTDDQQDSSAIQGALIASETQEDLQVYFLSRLRQIIFGKNSTDHWYDDFSVDGILSLKELSSLSSGSAPRRTGVELVGPLDGSNRVFRTNPDYFVHDVFGTGQTIEVWHNGRKLVQTDVAHPGTGDYTVEESGGVGTGFDTINLLTFSPIERSSLRANYFLA